MATRWGAIALLYLVGLAAAGQFARAAVALPLLAELYPGRPVAWTVSAVGVMGVVLGLVAGAVVARIGARRALVAAAWLGVGATLAQAVAPPFALLLAARIVEGAAHLAIVVAVPTLMATLAVGRDVPVVMGLWATFFGVGFALFGWVAPGLVAAGGWALLSAAHAAMLALPVALLAPRLPRAGGGGRSVRGFLAEHRAVYGDVRLAAPSLGFVWYTLTFLAGVTFAPILLPGAGLAVWLPLAGTAGTLAAGVLARRITPWSVARAAYVGTAAFMLASWLGPDALRSILLVAAFAVLGFVPGGSFAAIPALNATPEGRARSTGAIAQMGNVGSTLGTPILAGAIALAGPVALPFFVVALTLAGAATIGATTARIGRPRAAA